MRSGQGAQPLSRTLRIYQKAAIVFVLISFFLLLSVLYLSLSVAKIIIVPESTLVHTTVPIEIVATPLTEGQVSGFVQTETFVKAKTFATPEEGAQAVEGKAGGMVTLINETNAPQKLVATTRLLSEEGILFRLDEAVTVPANGQVETMARADLPGKSGDIGPTQFTIPGLSTSLQEVIYAVSVDAMKGGVSMVSVVTEEYLNEAEISLKEEMIREASDTMLARISGDDFDGSVFTSEVIERKSDTLPGVQTSEFTISLTLNITGVFYNHSILSEYAIAELGSQLQSGFELSEVHEEALQVSIDSVSKTTEAATLSLYIDGSSFITRSHEALNADRFAGLKEQEVITLLDPIEGIQSIRVEFSPFWLKRVPRLKDHIEIMIER